MVLNLWKPEHAKLIDCYQIMFIKDGARFGFSKEFTRANPRERNGWSHRISQLNETGYFAGREGNVRAQQSR